MELALVAAVFLVLMIALADRVTQPSEGWSKYGKNGLRKW